ncbi:hypothetical protein [Nannocystis radixulma]|uniref:Uncharacterized protein n=1 Tax=Nannocystis radixulma TaxID=2995305 RepID=A0ABT5BPC3_9BACT|nr:hypothetical protein [Nannocystis radixulma]MDC0676021.1 hypothetical protein [Nannocystis radixulma]
MPVRLFVLTFAVLAGDPARAREAAAFERARAGDHATSTQLLVDLANDRPTDDRVCLWRERIFLNATAGGDPSVMWRAAEELVARWRSMEHARAGALAQVCRADVSSALRYLGARWHIEGDAQCDRLRLELAERAYRTWLGEFGDDSDAPEVQFWLAELLLGRADLEARDPSHVCGTVTCGTADLRRRQERRDRGELPPACGAFADKPGEPRHCPFLRAARLAFVRALELDLRGPHAHHAAYAQVALAAAITQHDERERGYMCRTNKDGLCIVPAPGPRGPACPEPTPACHPHLAQVDRWPSIPLSGIARMLPSWRSP